MLKYGQPEVDQLSQRLLKLYLGTARKAIRELWAELGADPGQVRIMDADLLAKLEAEAKKWAEQIAETYNRNLRNFLNDALEEWREEHGSLRGLTRYRLGRMVRTKIWNYWRGRRVAGGWQPGKLRTIAVTEETRAYMMTLAEFVAKSKIQMMARVVPGMAVCDACRELVSRGWVDASSIDPDVFPLHPNCPHHFELRPVQIVDTALLWRGR
jgi:hypothetical protein